MQPPDRHPVPLADIRRVGDDARWVHWRALCAWTFRVWGLIMAGALLALYWLSEDLSHMILQSIITAGSTLLYREVVLFHWARRLRMLPLMQAIVRDRAARDDATAPVGSDDPDS
jgi:hypothetical protein